MTAPAAVLNRTRLVVIVAASFLALAHALRPYQSLISDDSYILMRYARNLLQGHGLAWNAGAAPVEGFTSLLHVLLYWTGLLLGIDGELTGQILGLASLVVAVPATAWLAAEAFDRDGRVATLAAVFMALAPGLAFWARGGLETVTFTALLSLAMAAWLHASRRGSRRLVASILFFLATLARPEAFGILMLTAAFDGWHQRGAALGDRLRRLVNWWPYALLLLALTVWKLVYFGALLPNSWHAKTGGGLLALGAGSVYVLTFLWRHGALGLLLAAVPLLLPGNRNRSSATYLAAAVAALLLHVALVGGDYQNFHRYLVPTLPMLLALAAGGSLQLYCAAAAWPRMPRAIASILVVGLAMSQLAHRSFHELAERPWLLSRPWHVVDRKLIDSLNFVIMGKALKRHVPPHRTVAALAVGAVGYYSERPILDLFGINDPELARMPLDLPRHDRWRPGHMKGNAAAVLARRPDYMLLHMLPADAPRQPPPESDRKKYPFIADLMGNPQFNARYALEAVALPDGRWLNLYRLHVPADPP